MSFLCSFHSHNLFPYFYSYSSPIFLSFPIILFPTSYLPSLPTLDTSNRKYPPDYPLPPGFSCEFLLHNSPIQNPSSPDTALTPISPTSDPSTSLYFSTLIPTIITTREFSFLSFIIQQCSFSTGMCVVSSPIHMTSAIYYLSMNLKLYAFKKSFWFKHPYQSLTTTSSILLILLLLLLFLFIIRHHILSSILKLLFIVQCYKLSFNVGLPLFLFISHLPILLILVTSTTLSPKFLPFDESVTLIVDIHYGEIQ